MKKYSIFGMLILSSFVSLSQIIFNKIQTSDNGDFPVALIDMNNDFRDDLVTINDDGELFIDYAPTSGASFRKIIDTLINTGPGILSWVSIAINDLNLDGENDIFVGDYSKSMLYYSNGTGGYTKIYLDTFFAQAANFIDMDNDGFVDLFVCNDEGDNFTYKNNGNGTLTRDTSMLGVFPYAGSYGAVWSDFDGDNDMDLYISKCKAGVTDSSDLRRVNLLYQNNGNGNYTEIAGQKGIDDGSQSWSSDFGDIDNDGDMDLFIANHHARNRLYEQVNDSFIEITFLSGLDTAKELGDYQSVFADLDNDGFIDLILAHSENPNLVYHNNGDKTFTAIQDSVPTKMRSFSVGDLNNDGFLDIYSVSSDAVTDNEIWLNSGNGNNHVVIKLLGDSTNPNSIGSVLKLFGPWGIQTREIRAGESYGIQNSFMNMFGLGNDGVDSLQVYNQNGTTCSITNLSVNWIHEINQNCNVNLIERTIGIEDSKVASSPKIRIYPNPASEFIQFQGINNLSHKSLKLFDAQGREVSKMISLDHEKMDVSKLPNGFYFYRILSNNSYAEGHFYIQRP